MNRHKLTLLGGDPDELRVAAAVLHETLGALLDGARQAARFLVEGESTRKGPRPAWLEAVCRVDIMGLSKGSAVVDLQAPTLEEADPEQFGDGGKGALFDDDARRLGRATAVDLFGQVLASLVEADADDVMADRPLLETCVRFARAAGNGFHAVQLEGIQGRSRPIVVRVEDIPRLEVVRNQTPSPQAARVYGVLDTISASRPEVTLRLGDGTKLPARLQEHDSKLLKGLFGSEVVVSGMARFRPSGRLLLIDVEWLSAAAESDRLFAAPPVARLQQPVVTAQPQDESSGVSTFFGTWPGEESEAELIEALEALR